jgi:hypothetical protein
VLRVQNEHGLVLFWLQVLVLMSPPKMKDSDELQPKYFAVDTPVLSKQGELQKEADGSLKKVKEFGVWTCFHKAHEPGWKAYIQTN